MLLRRTFLRLTATGLLWLAVGLPAWGASPSVAATSTSSASSAASITVTLPSGTASGNLVVIFIKGNGGNSTFTQSSGTTGWTELQDENGLAVYYKQVGASEANPSFDDSNTENIVAHAYRITGHEDPGTQAPETITQATATDSNPDPPSLTPTGGSKDYLWLACWGSAAPRNQTAIPTNYSNGLNTTEGTGGPAASIGSAERQLTAATENPGTFTINNNIAWKATTVAVHPSTATAARRVIVIGGGF